MTDLDEPLEIDDARRRAWEAHSQALAITHLVNRAVGAPDAKQPPSSPLTQLQAARVALEELEKRVKEIAYFEPLARQLWLDEAITDLPTDELLHEVREGVTLSVQSWHEVMGRIPDRHQPVVVDALRTKVRLLRRIAALERQVAEEWPPKPAELLA